MASNVVGSYFLAKESPLANTSIHQIQDSEQRFVNDTGINDRSLYTFKCKGWHKITQREVYRILKKSSDLNKLALSNSPLRLEILKSLNKVIDNMNARPN